MAIEFCMHKFSVTIFIIFVRGPYLNTQSRIYPRRVQLLNVITLNIGKVHMRIFFFIVTANNGHGVIQCEPYCPIARLGSKIACVVYGGKVSNT